MIGSQSGNKKGTKTVRKYYMCSKYQRKGKSACKFKSFSKEKIEAAVTNSLLKEFTFLSIDIVLAEEVMCFSNSMDKELTFKLNNINQQIEFISMRVDLANKELLFDKSKLDKYIDELKS